MIPKGTSHAVLADGPRGAEKAAQELNVDVVWRGPLREDDRESQVDRGGERRGARRGRDRARAARRVGARRPGLDRDEARHPGRDLRLGPQGRTTTSASSPPTTTPADGWPASTSPRLLNGKGRVAAPPLRRRARQHDPRREEGFLAAIEGQPGHRDRQLESVRRRRRRRRLQDGRRRILSGLKNAGRAA